MGSKRLLIVSASMGAGHDAAAAALAVQAEAEGHTVRTVDLLKMPPHGQGAVLRAFYHSMLAVIPWLYDWAMRTWVTHPGIFEAITHNGGRSAEKPLLAEVEQFQPDAIVAVYNLAAQVLGRLRSQGRLSTPIATYVTDPGAHPYWVWSGVDLTLAPMGATAVALEDMGADVVKPIAPLVAARYLEPVDRDAARERWEIDANARVVVVNGGSWGVGEVVSAVRQLTAAADVVLVLCGHSTRLARRIAGVPGVRAVPWTSDVIGVLASADVVVDNAGGTTCWEALALGKPTVLYRPIAGHGRLNAEALQQVGLARWATDVPELLASVRRATPPADTVGVFGCERAVDVLDTLW
ncbi:MAG TPA: glycosyltransferase [Mycobacteriales bacterium]|nr:glycosyltransferase [Mycobacteriales bacterium]